MRNKILFYLNGKRHELGHEYAGMMLADYLRYQKSLTGTKIVCAEGDCGACSVLRYFPHTYGTDNHNYLPINSCITPLANMDGSSLVTVDALKQGHDLHVTQKAMIQCHGSQCGFCTPGFVIALTGIVEEKIAKNECSLSAKEAKNGLTGNLCRCTGYQPIIEAAQAIDLASAHSVKERYFNSLQKEKLAHAFKTPLAIESDEFSYYAPKSIKEAQSYLLANPDAHIVGAATDLGVIHNKRKITLTKLLSLHLVEEMYQITEMNQEINVGARVTISEFRHFLKNRCAEFASYLDVFASPQIKNIATVIGNVANASPIGDMSSALLALDATVIINNVKEIALSEFFLAYRKTALQPGEIITAIKFQIPTQDCDFKIYKNANRKDLDISAVSFAIKVNWANKDKNEVREIFIAAGGVAATPLRFKKTEIFLKKQFDLEAAINILHSEFRPLDDVRASGSYRRLLVENYLRRFFSDDRGEK